jgi:hypothetical protein
MIGFGLRQQDSGMVLEKRASCTADVIKRVAIVAAIGKGARPFMPPAIGSAGAGRRVPPDNGVPPSSSPLVRRLW